MTVIINEETRRKIREERGKGSSIRRLAELYGYKRDKIDRLTRGVPVAGADERRKRCERVKEIMDTWEIALPTGNKKGVTRPSALKIFQLEEFVRTHPEHASIIGDILEGKRRIATTHRQFIKKVKKR